MTVVVSFRVLGDPQTKGSTKSFMHRGRIVTTSDNPKLKKWHETVSAVAAVAMAGRAPFTGPVWVRLEYALRRPAGHFRRDGTLRPSAPEWPITRRKSDIDKLERAVLDGIGAAPRTGRGRKSPSPPICYHDDSQVVTVSHTKRWCAVGESPGIYVTLNADELSAPVEEEPNGKTTQAPEAEDSGRPEAGRAPAGDQTRR